MASIDTEISAHVTRIKSFPPDFTTATIKTESYLSSLRDRKQTLIAATGKTNTWQEPPTRLETWLSSSAGRSGFAQTPSY